MKNKVENIVIVILSIALAVTSFSAVFNVIDYGWSYEVDEDSFWYKMSEENYPDMLLAYYMNESGQEEWDEDLTPYYAVAKYFEAASFYKAYEEAGEEEKAAQRLEEMDQMMALMGVFEAEKEKIDKKLGLN